MTIERGRNWATILYPDNENMNIFTSMQKLEDLNIPIFISPIHDKDLDGDGVIKKPHYHVMLMFSGNKSYSQLDSLVKSFGGVGLERINDLRSYARYLCHLDSFHKVKYKTTDVYSFGGADYQSTINLVIDKISAVKEMILFCQEEHIYEFSDLVDYCISERDDWFRFLVEGSTSFVDKYLKSKLYKMRDEEIKRIKALHLKE